MTNYHSHHKEFKCICELQNASETEICENEKRRLRWLGAEDSYRCFCGEHTWIKEYLKGAVKGTEKQAWFKKICKKYVIINHA